MSIRKKLAKSVPFVHLLGIHAEEETQEDREKREEDEARRAEWEKKAEDDPERERRDDESDEEYVKRMEEMDEDEEDEARRAEDRKARGDEEDVDDEARRAERARCAEIIAYGVANGCVRQAAVFAFDTNMSARVSIANMKATRADGKQGLGARMSEVKVAAVGVSGGAAPSPSDPKAVADAIIRSAQKARGEA